MPFRARFDCLWCGDAWTAGGRGDLEGWAQLCPTCLGRAGSNAFLRGRLRTALAERGAAGGSVRETVSRLEAEAEADAEAKAGESEAETEAVEAGAAEAEAGPEPEADAAESEAEPEAEPEAAGAEAGAAEAEPGAEAGPEADAAKAEARGPEAGGPEAQGEGGVDAAGSAAEAAKARPGVLPETQRTSADTPAGARLELSAPRAAPIIRRPAHPAAAFPDDWFLRRGPFERGPVHDTAWAAELDVVTRWLDAQPLRGRILEPAAGVGFFSPLLAERGELHATDVDGAALDIARSRLVAHRLRAHLHVADPFAPPSPDEPPFDALVAAFLLGRVRGAGVDPAAASLRSRLRQGARLAVIDLRHDPAGGPPPGIAWSYHDLAVLEAALARAGFARIKVSLTGRFFVTASAAAV